MSQLFVMLLLGALTYWFFYVNRDAYLMTFLTDGGGGARTDNPFLRQATVPASDVAATPVIGAVDDCHLEKPRTHRASTTAREKCNVDEGR